jgi:hypothetical protein
MCVGWVDVGCFVGDWSCGKDDWVYVVENEWTLTKLEMSRKRVGGAAGYSSSL